MENLNLVLKFKTAGRDDVHVKGAARITVDGRGGLLFYDALSGRAERIDVENVQLFYIPQMSAGQGPSLHSHLVC
jgi:hypothetical protein